MVGLSEQVRVLFDKGNPMSLSLLPAEIINRSRELFGDGFDEYSDTFCPGIWGDRWGTVIENVLNKEFTKYIPTRGVSEYGNVYYVPVLQVGCGRAFGNPIYVIDKKKLPENYIMTERDILFCDESQVKLACQARCDLALLQTRRVALLSVLQGFDVVLI